MHPPPKIHFQWRVPKASRRPTGGLQLALIIALAVGAILYFNPQDPPFSGLNIALRSLFAGWTLAYALPWLLSRLQSEVHLLDTEIEEGPRGLFGILIQKAPYKTYKSFSWAITQDFATLTLKPHSRFKGNLILGIPLEAPREAISTFLTQHHLTPEP